MSRGSLFHIPTDDARAILDRILETEMDNTLHDETHEAEVDTLPNSPSTIAIPSSELQRKKFHHLVSCWIYNPIFLLILGTFQTTILKTEPKTAILAFVCQMNIN